MPLTKFQILTLLGLVWKVDEGQCCKSLTTLFLVLGALFVVQCRNIEPLAKLSNFDKIGPYVESS